MEYPLDEATSKDLSDVGGRFYKRDFWSQENLKYSAPHYRLLKSAHVINRIALGQRRTLLDVGCGPAALAHLLDSNIDYFGIDIAIQQPSPRLTELDFVESPIDFGGKRFDIVVAQGVFEYMGGCQRQKFQELSDLLPSNGTLLVSYVNFDHRRRHVYEPYNNVQNIGRFRSDLEKFFVVRKCIPTSHNWGHAEPRRRLLRMLNFHLNVKIPVLTQLLAVEYFFICSPR
jgi:SAM-dependent methyltransferase